MSGHYAIVKITCQYLLIYFVCFSFLSLEAYVLMPIHF